jgi:hypothetical protein
MYCRARSTSMERGTGGNENRKRHGAPRPFPRAPEFSPHRAAGALRTWPVLLLGWRPFPLMKPLCPWTVCHTSSLPSPISRSPPRLSSRLTSNFLYICLFYVIPPLMPVSALAMACKSLGSASPCGKLFAPPRSCTSFPLSFLPLGHLSQCSCSLHPLARFFTRILGIRSS